MYTSRLSYLQYQNKFSKYECLLKQTTNDPIKWHRFPNTDWTVKKNNRQTWFVRLIWFHCYDNENSTSPIVRWDILEIFVFKMQAHAYMRASTITTFKFIKLYISTVFTHSVWQRHDDRSRGISDEKYRRARSNVGPLKKPVKHRSHVRNPFSRYRSDTEGNRADVGTTIQR